MATHKFSEDEIAAREAIKEDGFAAVLEQAGSTTGSNAANPTAGAPVEFPVFVVFTKSATNEQERDAIRRGMRIALMSTEGLDDVVVKPNDYLVVGTKRFRITDPNPLEPAGVPIFYKLIAKQ